MELILLVLLLAVGSLFTLVIPAFHARDADGVSGKILRLSGNIRMWPRGFRSR